MHVQMLTMSSLPGLHTTKSAPDRCSVYFARSASIQTVIALPRPLSPSNSKPPCSPTMVRAPSQPITYCATTSNSSPPSRGRTRTVTDSPSSRSQTTSWWRRISAPRSRACSSMIGSRMCWGMLHISHGLAARYSPIRSSPVPQVIIRESSRPAKDVANTCLPISWWGSARAITRSSMPRSRRISTARWLVMWARGELAVAYFVTVSESMPARARSDAAVRPAGPAPTMSTSVVMVSIPLLH